MQRALLGIIVLGVFGIVACSEGGMPQETIASAGSGSGTAEGSGSGEPPCWVASRTGLCPAQPRGSRIEDCPSGQLFAADGFSAATGTCRPNLPDSTCPAGWLAVPSVTDGSGAEQPDDSLQQYRHCEPPPPPERCPAGTLALPGSDVCLPIGTGCPPEADRWPDEATLRTLAPGFEGPILYAAADAAADGVGTRDNPRLLGAATLRAAENGIVALAVGDYTAAIRLDRRVALVGACVAGTLLSAATASDSTGVVDIASSMPVALANLSLTGDRPGVTVQPGAPSAHELSSLAILGTRTAGILVSGPQPVRLSSITIEGTRATTSRSFGRALSLTEGATVTARDLSLRGNRDIALSLDGLGTAITADRLLIADTIERLTDGTFGRAIDLRGGATATLTGALLRNNREVAIAADGEGTVLTATQLAVVGTRARARDSVAGRGLELTGGATATFTGASFRDHLDLTLSLDGLGTRATLTEVVVRDTRGALLTGRGGYGASVTGGATLEATSCVVANNRSAGLLASGLRTRLSIADSLVAATEPDSAGAGNGIAVESGAVADLQRMLLAGNTEAGLFATEGGSRVEVYDLTVTDTRSNPADGRAGLGLWLQEGAAFVGDRMLLRDNRFAGLYATGGATTVSASQLVVADTRPQSGDGRGGMGLFLTNGATATASSAVLQGNHEVGLLLDDATATLRDALIADTLPRATGLHGSGVELQRGATLSLERALLQRSRGVGLLVTDAGSRLNFAELAIEATAPRPAPLSGFGTGMALTAGGGAAGTDLTLSGNSLCGLQLAGDALVLDIDRARLSFNAVGIAIQGPGFGLAELRSALRGERFDGNGTDISTDRLDLPEPVLDLR